MALVYTAKLPEGVTASVSGRDVTVKGPKGELKRVLGQIGVKITADGDAIVIKSEQSGKREKRLMGSIQAHLNNMITGVVTPFTYKLKICASHFPMNVTLNKNRLIVKNFLGEKVPREISFDKDVDVKIDGDVIVVVSPDIEMAGCTASKFEGITFVSKRDRRIFQDGIYVTHKPGVEE